MPEFGRNKPSMMLFLCIALGMITLILQGVNIITTLNEWASCFSWNEAMLKKYKDSDINSLQTFKTYIQSLEPGISRPFGRLTSYVSVSSDLSKLSKPLDPAQDTRKYTAFTMIGIGGVGILILSLVYIFHIPAREGFVQALFTTYEKDEGSGVKGGMVALFVSILIMVGVGIAINQSILVQWGKDVHSDSFNQQYGNDGQTTENCRGPNSPEYISVVSGNPNPSLNGSKGGLTSWGKWGKTVSGQFRPMFLVSCIIFPSVYFLCACAQGVVFYFDPRTLGGDSKVTISSQLRLYSRKKNKLVKQQIKALNSSDNLTAQKLNNEALKYEAVLKKIRDLNMPGNKRIAKSKINQILRSSGIDIGGKIQLVYQGDPVAEARQQQMLSNQLSNQAQIPNQEDEMMMELYDAEGGVDGDDLGDFEEITENPGFNIENAASATEGETM